MRAGKRVIMSRLRFTVRVKLAANPVNQGIAVALYSPKATQQTAIGPLGKLSSGLPGANYR